MVTIAGLTVYPSAYAVGIQDITEAIRNGNGTLIADRIATKRTIDVSWLYLTNAQMAQILTLFTSNFYVSVTYPDPVSGTNETRTFYPGDRKGGVFKLQSGNIVGWKDVSFSMIEV
jgi:hypothetical protein